MEVFTELLDYLTWLVAALNDIFAYITATLGLG